MLDASEELGQFAARPVAASGEVDRGMPAGEGISSSRTRSLSTLPLGPD